MMKLIPHHLWLWPPPFLCWGSDGQNGKPPALWPANLGKTRKIHYELQTSHQIAACQRRKQRWGLTSQPICAPPATSAECGQSASGSRDTWTRSRGGTRRPPPPPTLISCPRAAGGGRGGGKGQKWKKKEKKYIHTFAEVLRVCPPWASSHPAALSWRMAWCSPAVSEVSWPRGRRSVAWPASWGRGLDDGSEKTQL